MREYRHRNKALGAGDSKMAMKLITRVLDSCDASINQCWAKVYRDSEYEEFVVKFYRHAEYVGSAADYFTNDKSDALVTAKTQCLKGY
jgi:hypothetical protein